MPEGAERQIGTHSARLAFELLRIFFVFRIARVPTRCSFELLGTSGGVSVLNDFKVFAVLPSRDVVAARAWYQEKTDTSPTTEDPGGLWYECAEGTWFIITGSPFAGTAQNTAASFQVKNIENVMAEYKQRGVTFEEYDLPDFKTENGMFSMGPYKAAWFKDLDGNTIELTEVAEEA